MYRRPVSVETVDDILARTRYTAHPAFGLRRYEKQKDQVSSVGKLPLEWLQTDRAVRLQREEEFFTALLTGLIARRRLRFKVTLSKQAQREIGPRLLGVPDTEGALHGAVTRESAALLAQARPSKLELVDDYEMPVFASSAAWLSTELQIGDGEAVELRGSLEQAVSTRATPTVAEPRRALRPVARGIAIRACHYASIVPLAILGLFLDHSGIGAPLIWPIAIGSTAAVMIVLDRLGKLFTARA
jgi:hypothetical protein